MPSVAGDPASAEATPVRGWIWLQLAIAWLPVWALYSSMMLSMHGGPASRALLIAGRAIGVAALLGMLVLRWTERLEWPRHLSFRFVAGHVVGAAVYAAAWMSLTSLLEGALRGRLNLTSPAGTIPFLVIGVWLYFVVAGVSYAARATARAARAEATAARSQLAALRGQLNPHFLFNALHTVVQLIPVEPARAGEAAEQLAGLLRTASEEDRDLVPLSEERAFVERYLALEALRFGDRLRWSTDVDPRATHAIVPSFVLQTLVENAVRHGAAPREEPTTLTLTARVEGTQLVIGVADTGAGSSEGALATGGTGLRRLRERLAALYGADASLVAAPGKLGGFTATVRLPFDADADADADATHEMTPSNAAPGAPPEARVRVVIADDEPIARAGLRRMLEAVEWITVVGEAPHGRGAIETIDRLLPDLVFLDIQMPGLLGTDVPARLVHQPFIVFTTAYAEHAVTAFELGAVDYLLKPFGAPRLAAALERVRAALGERAEVAPFDRLGEALAKGPVTRLFVRNGTAIAPVAVASVHWFEADGDYVIAHAERARHVLTLPLARLEARLDPRRFMRIHRAHIVNLDHVTTFRRHGKGGMTAELRDGTQLAVSRARAQELRKLGV